MVKPRIAIVGLGLIGTTQLARRLPERRLRSRPHGTTTTAPTPPPEADPASSCKPTLAALAETKPNPLAPRNLLKAMPEILGALKPLIDTETTTLTDVGSVKGMVDAMNRSHWS